jgi:Bacterial aa3 type cytochrome c oxidase subunit IV
MPTGTRAALKSWLCGFFGEKSWSYLLEGCKKLGIAVVATVMPRRGNTMSEPHAGRHPDMDYAEHERTYDGFLTGTKVLIGLVAIILVGMFVFLV